MKIELFDSHVRDDVVELKCKPDEVGILDMEGYQFIDPVMVSCDVQTGEDLVVLKAIVKTRVTVECARCLTAFPEELRGEFSLVVRKLRKGEVLRAPVCEEEENNDDSLLYVDNDTNEVEIGEYVHDALLLELPLKPVCSPECRGLCSICGTNLNEGDCSCSNGKPDNRWNALSGLFDGKDAP